MNLVKYKNHIQVIIAATAFGSLGLIVRSFPEGIPETTLSFLRILGSFVIMALFFLIYKRKEIYIPKNRKNFILLVISGFIGYGLMAVSFTFAVLNTNIGNAYFLLFTAPIYTTIFSYLFFKEKIKSKFLIVIGFSLIGMFLIFNPSNIFANLKGNLWGVIAGFSYGVYITIIRYLSKTENNENKTFWSLLFGLISLILAIFIIDNSFWSEINKNSELLYDSILPTVLSGIVIFTSYFLLNIALDKLNAVLASLLLLFEPISALFFGILDREIPTFIEIVGMTIILLSLIILNLPQRKIFEFIKR